MQRREGASNRPFFYACAWSDEDGALFSFVLCLHHQFDERFDEEKPQHDKHDGLDGTRALPAIEVKASMRRERIDSTMFRAGFLSGFCCLNILYRAT